ncbi:MAG TPA: hypothetical protein VKW04_00450 [Planctomycetota bacterium]|nr:hypothetical protein [Planctomycetota bacterium]
MSSKRAWVWAGRVVALIAAVVIPACGTTGGSGLPGANGIMWNSPATGQPQQGGSGTGGSLWVNPNSGLGASQIGISNIITSSDDATYESWAPTGVSGLNTTTVQYIIASQGSAQHPLSTDTGADAITSRESSLEGQINGYRQQQLGNVGGGGINGGIAVGNVSGIILTGHFIGTKMARAHCKHYALNHGGFPAQENFEGDAMLSTNMGNALQNPPLGNAFGLGSNPAAIPPLLKNPNGNLGRLGKLGVIAYDPNTKFTGAVVTNDSIVYSGAIFDEPEVVFSHMLVDFPFEMGALGWTNLAVGHWRGGTNGYYWNIIFLLNPNPLN